MISFFRKIRQSLLTQNRVTRYLVYALGEIVLVVIGILIALQINNANEDYKIKKAEKAVLLNFIQDLRDDSISFSNDLETLSRIHSLHKTLYEIGVLEKVHEIDFPNAIRRLPFFNQIALENDPTIASKISNEAVRKEILTYSKNLNDLESSYEELEEVITQRIRIKLGEQNAQNLSKWFEDPTFPSIDEINYDFVEKEDLVILAKQPEFQQVLLEASIKAKETGFTMNIAKNQNHKLKELILIELEK